MMHLYKTLILQMASVICPGDFSQEALIIHTVVRNLDTLSVVSSLLAILLLEVACSHLNCSVFIIATN
jgi:hypothetical protein